MQLWCLYYTVLLLWLPSPVMWCHIQQQLLYMPQIHCNSIFYLDTDVAELAEEEVDYVSGPRTFGRQETLCCVFYCLYCFVNMHFYMTIIIAYIKIVFRMSLFYVKAKLLSAHPLSQSCQIKFHCSLVEVNFSSTLKVEAAKSPET